ALPDRNLCANVTAHQNGRTRSRGVGALHFWLLNGFGTVVAPTSPNNEAFRVQSLYSKCKFSFERMIIWPMTLVLIVAEAARFAVAIVAEAVSIGSPVCWMIYVLDAKGQEWNAVRNAVEPASGTRPALQRPISYSEMDEASYRIECLCKAYKATL